MTRHVAILVTLAALSSGDQPLSTTFERSYGAVGDQFAVGVVPMPDSGFLLAGGTDSGPGTSGLYFLRTDANGESLWSRTAVESGIPTIPYAAVRDDGYGCVIVGRRRSGLTDWDWFAAKLDSSGVIEWFTVHGARGEDDVAQAVCRTVDGCWLLCGYTLESGEPDIQLNLLTSSGQRVWTVRVGTANPDIGYAVCSAPDGGYIVAGATCPTGSRFTDLYLVRTDRDGNVLWSRTYGDTLWDEARCVQETSDGDIVAAGFSASYGVGTDMYLLRTDSLGGMRWFRTYGFDGSDRCLGMSATLDGGFVLTGGSDLLGGQGTNVDLVKTGTTGYLQWQRLFGGIGDRIAYTVTQLPDSGFITAGKRWVDSMRGDDVYAVRTAANGSIDVDDRRPDERKPRQLAQPNPFCHGVDIHVSMPGPVRVVSASGRLVLEARTISMIRWDGRDMAGQPAPPGVYFAALPGGDVVAIVKAR